MNEAIQDAIRTDDFSKFAILAAAAGPKWRDKKGRPLIHIACEFDAVECVRFLLTTTNPFSRNVLGQTSLMVAVIHHSHRVVDLLLSSDLTASRENTWPEETSDVRAKRLYDLRVPEYTHHFFDAKDLNGQTALIHAVIHGNLHDFNSLKSACGANDIADESGRSAITWSCIFGTSDLFEPTVGWNSDIHKRTNLAYSVIFDQAQQVQSRARLSTMSREATLADDLGMTPLMYAALHGFETSVKYLIPASDVNAANNDGLTALMIAAKAGHSECVERIMRRPSDGNLQDKKGRTALIHAAMQGHAECVDWLIPRCNPNFTDIAGLNALRNAIRAGHVNCIDLLLPVSEAATTEQQQWQLMALASMSNSAICLQRVMDINGFAFGGLNFAHREHSWIFYKLEELILDAVKDGSLESIKILLPITRGHAGYNNMVNTAYQLLEEFPYIALVDYLDSLK